MTLTLALVLLGACVRWEQPDLDGDGVTVAQGDCADLDPSVNPGAAEVWYDAVDQDCDGNDADQDLDGFLAAEVGGDDCDDTRAEVQPEATELWYDGVDQDCSGTSDFDQDGDGQDSQEHGGDDCDDLDPAVNTGASEIWYDGVDQDCAGDSDYDQDGDGWAVTVDCDDTNPGANPDTAEVWYDGVDQDCDGNDGDLDGDGFDATQAGGADCDDEDATVFPGAPGDVPYDGVDQDCTDVDPWDDYDGDGDGYPASEWDVWAEVEGDCDDTSELVSPGRSERCDTPLDDDCDGDDNDVDADGCTVFTLDADRDRYGTTVTQCSCEPIAPYDQDDADDCDDGRASVNPGGTEVCNGLDDDCDTLLDEPGAADGTRYYADADLDGHGDDGDVGERYCADPGLGYSLSRDDCDDAVSTTFPGASETCNGVDDDCDTAKDERGAVDGTRYYTDADRDTFGDATDVGDTFCTNPGTGWSLTNSDCDDGRAAVNPAESEICSTAYDDDCDAAVNEQGALDGTRYYPDLDTDSYGDATDAGDTFCSNPGAGWDRDNLDCDDGDALISPADPERCSSSADDDCDGAVDEVGAADGTRYYVDADRDTYGKAGDAGSTWCTNPGTGYSLSDDDCDDGRASVNPAVAELCSTAYDDDCDTLSNEPGAVDGTTYYTDGDRDGYGSSADPGETWCTNPGSGFDRDNLDCDDGDALVSPADPERCGTADDDDCDGAVQEAGASDGTRYYTDADGDGYGDESDPGERYCTSPGAGHSLTHDDCDDGTKAVGPGVDELCSTVGDDDCDGAVNEQGASDGTRYYADADRDGHGSLADAGDTFCATPGAGWDADNDDCDDGDALVSPSDPERCSTADDDDCDGAVQEAGASDGTRYYLDADGDGYGDETDPGERYCTPPGGGYARFNDDCDDGSTSVSPGAPELCSTSSVDDDCDGSLNEQGAADGTRYYRDADRDGHGSSTDAGDTFCTSPGTGWDADNDDCDDGDALVSPSDPERCSTLEDDDCDGSVQETGASDGTLYHVDADGDGHGDAADSGERYCTNPGTGYARSDDDCDDDNGDVYAGAEELDDDLDEDCDDRVDEDFLQAGDLLITELHFNPTDWPDTGTEEPLEWFEVLNTSATRDRVLDGLEIEESNCGDTSVFVGLGGLLIPAGGYAVICATSTIPDVVCDYVWGEDLNGTSLAGPTWDEELCLGNSGTSSLRLFMGATLLDQVSWKTSSSWPGSEDGVSIVLDPSAEASGDNDSGTDWCWPGSSEEYDTKLGNVGNPGLPTDTCNGAWPNSN